MKLRRTARYYKDHPEAVAKKKEYDTKYESTPDRKKYRAHLNRVRRKRGLKGSEKDLSHTKDGKLVLENKSTNRARNGADKSSTLK